jgi:hypothetical protein
VVRDLGSTNGTRVNGEKVTEQKMRRNDHLRLGNIELLYDSEHQPPGQPMPQPSARVNLNDCASHGRPPGFTNAAPVAKPARGRLAAKWVYGIVAGVLLALGGVGYFVWTVIVNPPAPS